MFFEDFVLRPSVKAVGDDAFLAGVDEVLDLFYDAIDDDVFAKIIACTRISTPYTGMIISTRESKACREKVIHYGISQISGASRTSVGGYDNAEREHDSEQFDVSDQRTLDEVVRWLMDLVKYHVKFSVLKMKK